MCASILTVGEQICRLLLSDHGRGLVAVDEATGQGLPRVTWDGEWLPIAVERLSSLATELLGVEAHVTRHVAEAGFGRRLGAGVWSADVCEIHIEPARLAEANCRWVQLGERSSFSTEEAEIVTELLAQGDSHDGRADWERPGWRDWAAEWATAVLGERGLTLDRFELVKGAWPCSAVARLCASGSEVFYLKAVNEKPPFEFDVVENLRSVQPDAVPELVAVDRARRWMVTADLGAARWTEDAESVASAFAHLQLAVGDHTALTRAGCPQLTPHALREQLGVMAADLDLFRGVAGGVPLPAEARVDPLTAEFSEAIEALSRSAVGPAIIHQDFRLSNTAGPADRPVFFDWADTAIGHPFTSVAFFLEYYRPAGVPRDAIDLDHPLDGPRRAVRDAYLEPFRSRYGRGVDDDFRAVWRLFPLLQALRHHRELRYVDPASPWAMTLRGSILGDWDRAADRLKA